MTNTFSKPGERGTSAAIADPPPYRIAVVAPSPFYYHASMYRLLAAQKEIELKVYFCSKEALNGTQVSRQFKSRGNWGIEGQLLEGYDHKFLRNYALNPSYLRSATGLANFGIWNELKRERPHLVVLMAWVNPTWWIAIAACRVFGIPFVLMTDQNIQNELVKSKWKTFLKDFFLGKLIFPRSAGFLSAGTSNDRFYQRYRVPGHKVIPFAFAWGYDELLVEADRYAGQRCQIRIDLNIPPTTFVILFSGRFAPEKALDKLLRAYEVLNLPHAALAFVGDGDLLPAMKEYVEERQLSNVFFFGFRDRTEIARFYAMADVLVLPSVQETWGMVVNEAMCFGLPVIVSDRVGAGPDLVRHGQNGYVYPANDVSQLAKYLGQIATLTADQHREMGQASRKIIQDWVAKDRAGELIRFLNATYESDDHEPPVQ